MLDSLPESERNKLKALQALEQALGNWNMEYDSALDYCVEVVRPGHPVHSAVVSLKPFYGGILPRPAITHWRRFLKLTRRDDDQAEDEATSLLDWVKERIKELCGEKPVAAAEIADVDRACVPLTALQTKIVQFLWLRKHATNFDALAQHCWENGAEDENIVRCLKRVRKKWVDSGVADQFFLRLDFEISAAKRTIKLVRPGQ